MNFRNFFEQKDVGLLTPTFWISLCFILVRFPGIYFLYLEYHLQGRIMSLGRVCMGPEDWESMVDIVGL